MTAREFLVKIAGDDHMFHSVVSKSRVRVLVTVDEEKTKRLIKVTCSCGEVFETVVTEEGTQALKNVRIPEDQS